MPVNAYPTTVLTVFEKQNFISRFNITAGSTLTSYTITPSDTVSSSFANQVTVSIDSDQRSSLTISGYYDDIFVNTTVTGVPARSSLLRSNQGTSITTWTNWTSIPTDPYPYAITGFDPDPRTRIDMTITIVTNNGTTSLVQWVRNDYNYWRNRFLALVHNSQVDAETNNNSYRAPDLPLPANIDSDTLKQIYIFSTSISTNIQNFNLMTAATAAGYDSTLPLFATVSINAGVYVWSDDTSLPAFQTGTLPSGVGFHNISLTNNGFIMGKGGRGGGSPGPGFPGGPAISLGYDITITNNSFIGGGGGGGGKFGGGGAGGGAGGSTSQAGGAGGAPGFAGNNGSTNGYNSAGAGGGGRIMPGVGGAPLSAWGSGGRGGGAGGGGGGSGAQSGSFSGSGGTGGSAGNSGTVGTGPADVAQFGTGPGGGGGGWGAAGGGGNNPGGQGGVPYTQPGGSGGKAIALNGYTVTYGNLGTIYGAVS
jgi:hypothetical protein